MDLSTQAGQEILADIEQNTSSVRGWRNLMLLCIDQKDSETFKTLQIICNGLEKLFEQKKQEAKKEFEAAVKAIRESKVKVSQRRLPNPIVTTIPMSELQRATFLKLSRTPNNNALLGKVADYYLNDWNLPECAQTHLQRALNFEPEDQHASDSLAKAVAALARSIPAIASTTAEKSGLLPSAEPVRVSFNDTMRIKMPTMLRKATGPLPTERSQTLLDQHIDRAHQKQAPREKQTGLKTANLGALHKQLKTLQSKIEMIEKWANLDAPTPEASLTAPPSPKALDTEHSADHAISTASSSELLSRSLHAIQAGKLDDAANHCRHALQLNPDQPLVWHTWATIGLGYFENRRFDDAIEAFNQALRLEPNAVESWFNMGVAYAEKGDTEGALRCYLRSLFLAPDNPKVRCNLGAVYFQNNQFEHAENCFRTAIDLQPSYARAWDNLGATLSAMGKLDDAARVCRKAVELKPDYAEAWFKLGTILFQADETAQALHAFEKAAALRQDFPATFVYLAILCARNARFEEAEIACKKFTFLGGVSGLDWMAWQEIALAKLLANRLDESIKAAIHATQLQPSEPEPWFTLGVAHHQAGSYQEAEKAYSHTTTISPAMPTAWYNLGLVRQELKLHARAIDAFEHALELDGQNALIWYFLGRAHESLTQLRLAIEAYQKAVDLNAGMVEAWQNLGALLEEVGHHDQAEAAKQKALEALEAHS